MAGNPGRAGLVVLLASVWLAGCGGDGGVNSTPAATAPFPVKSGVSYAGATATMGYNGTLASGVSGSSATVTPAVSAQASATTLAYNATSDTYTVQAGGASASFAPASKTAASGYAANYVSGGDSLSLYGNAVAGTTGTAPVTLTYASFALWTHTDAATNQTTLTYYAYGQPTATNSMPVSGSASYDTTVSAYMLQSNYVPTSGTALTGTASFTANFANGTIATSLSLQPQGGAIAGSAGVYGGTGTISGSTFAGTFTTGTNAFVSGTFNGGFFGPSAAEMAYAFAIRGHNADPYAGATVAPGDISIAGVVLGARH
ncbi:hypothetical protein GTZ99_00740 [Novosphingobium sp. FSY-8]|uniref:Transferrin-binding protein B C-lobe/N-lobe beta-barrel domain-containing protein n=1 Tax=Novosphingobium ovatum TaxID=1908523 RepID=A0ABW9X968_9SPHN|nr:transferrin-binding protein-like solute binding protein [Novosphingobium ovatum]NBC35080.1 hypothetical protein [Novosphingobium ovatum]